jgi:ribonuclease HI
MNDDNFVIIYCDGACSGNQFAQNKGGWGALLIFQDHTKEIYGGEINTTNQRMELTACIKALGLLKSDKYPIQVFSDSAYLISGMTEKWYEKWMVNGWRNSRKQSVENVDLWKILIEMANKYTITYHKVEAHSGDLLNERVDNLAQRGIESIK